MSRISINGRAVSAYLLVLVLVYLAGTYVGAFYLYLYAFMIVLPIYSIVQVVVSTWRLECFQSVDNDAPVKGDIVRYQVWVTNKPLLTASALIRFKPIHPRLLDRLPELCVPLTGSRLEERSFEVHLRHRGIYTIGIEGIRITDPLGWLTLSREGSFRSVQVRPRVLPLVSPPAETRVRAVQESGMNGVQQDLTMFEGLSSYRDGQPVKQIAWKKYFTTGAPFLKQFGGSSEPAVIVYLDLRTPVGGLASDYETLLTTEDCAIEMTISLVKGYLDRGIRTKVRCSAERSYSFVGNASIDFPQFYDDTDTLVFSPLAASPARLYEADRSEGQAEGSVLFVTHLPDEEIFEVATERDKVGERTGVFVNLTGMSSSERELAEGYAGRLRLMESGMYFSAHADSLREDLAGWQAVQR